jgi:hypothetical protein
VIPTPNVNADRAGRQKKHRLFEMSAVGCNVSKWCGFPFQGFDDNVLKRIAGKPTLDHHNVRVRIAVRRDLGETVDAHSSTHCRTSR